MHEMDEVSPVKMTKKLRNQLCDVSDSDCILVKFSNKEENDQYAVGFAAWLKGNADGIFDLTSLIKKKEELIIYWPIDVSVRPVKTIQKYLIKAQFYEEVITLLSSGDWMNMKKNLKSLEKKGKLDVSKNSRKDVMRRQTESSTKTTEPKNKFLKAAKATAAKRQNENIMKNQPKLPHLYEDLNWDNEQVEENDDHEESYSERDMSDSGVGDISNVNVSSPPQSSITIYKKQSMSQEQHTNESRFNSGNSNDIRYAEFKNNVQEDRRSSGVGVSTREGSSNPISDLPAGVKRAPPLPDSIIKACLTKKKIQSFVSGLVDNFFEKSYLANHSPTGQTPNMFLAVNASPRPPLHPPTVKYIRELVTTHFGSQVGIHGKVTKALSDKIAAARPKKKKGQTNATAAGNE